MKSWTRIVLVLACAVVGVVLTSPPMTAQSRNPLGGFWIGGGIGGGVGRAECPVCAGDRDSGLSGLLGLGGTVSPRVRLGVEGSGWQKREEDLKYELGAVNAVAYWYPNPDGVPWFLKTGFGVIGYRVSDNDDDVNDNITSMSFGGQFGIGYDLRLGIVSLSPYFNFAGSFFADLEEQGERLTDVTLTLIQFGIGLGLH